MVIIKKHNLLMNHFSIIKQDLLKTKLVIFGVHSLYGFGEYNIVFIISSVGGLVYFIFSTGLYDKI